MLKLLFNLIFFLSKLFRQKGGDGGKSQTTINRHSALRYRKKY